MASGDVQALQITKPAEDKRGYHRFVLPNKLRCVLVSDPDTPQMAACLSVSVGYFNDPDGAEGAAKWIELMVLQGNRHYNDFSQFILQSKGVIKSYTATERTTFCYTASSDLLQDTLARFSEFFVEQALGSPDTILEDLPGSHLKEQHALNELEKHITDKDHPLHKFHSDNWKKISTKAKEGDVNLSKILQEFYESNYSADMMALVVYGREKLEDLQTIVEKHFSSVRKREVPEVPELRVTTHPCGDQFRKIVKVAVTNGRRLTLQWPLIRNIRSKEEVDACSYLTHVFGYDTEGSLFHILKQTGWSTNANCCEMDCNSHFSIFSICIELTAEGEENFEYACGLVFKYIKMLKKEKPRKYIFDELRAVSWDQFNSGVVSRSLDHVDNICRNMLVFPAAEWLTGSKVPLKYSLKTITDMVKEQLTHENVRIFLESDKVEGQEKFNGILYSVESVPASVIKMWMDKSPNVNMFLPTKDSLTAATVELKTVNEKALALHSLPRSPVKKTKELKSDTINEKTYALRNRQRNLNSKRDEKCEVLAEKVSGIRHSQRVLVMKQEQKSHPTALQVPAPHPQEYFMEENAGKVCLIYDKRMLKHIPPRKHVEKPERIAAIYRKLQAENLLERCVVYESECARLKYVLHVHKDKYFRSILSQRETKDDKGDMYFGENSLDAILLAAGGAIKACKKVVTGEHANAFAIVRPPGHHAKKAMGGGFCYFNNIAVGAKYLMEKHGTKKVLILDWDVHFCDGTEDIFRESADVLVISMHRLGLFPDLDGNHFRRFAYSGNIGKGAGTGYNCNLCWSDSKVGNDDLYGVFDYIVMPLIQDFKPEIILISAGFDAAKGDLLGDCWVTHVGYATVLHKLLKLKIGLVLILEGGYNLEVLGECCASCVRVLSGDYTVVDDREEYFPLASTWDAILQLRASLSCYWESLKPDIPEDVLARKQPNPNHAKIPNPDHAKIPD